jgi:hypothetical protein
VVEEYNVLGGLRQDVFARPVPEHGWRRGSSGESSATSDEISTRSGKSSTMRAQRGAVRAQRELGEEQREVGEERRELSESSMRAQRGVPGVAGDVVEQRELGNEPDEER